MPTLDIPTSDRLQALKDFIAQAEDPAAARTFILDILDPETDADLLDYLADDHTENS